MSENITSNSQSGGITAHTVNFGQNTELLPTKKKMPKWKKIGIWVVGSVAFLSSFVAVLDYINIKPSPTKEINDQNDTMNQGESNHMEKKQTNINIT